MAIGRQVFDPALLQGRKKKLQELLAQFLGGQAQGQGTVNTPLGQGNLAFAPGELPRAALPSITIPPFRGRQQVGGERLSPVGGPDISPAFGIPAPGFDRVLSSDNIQQALRNFGAIKASRGAVPPGTPVNPVEGQAGGGTSAGGSGPGGVPVAPGTPQNPVNTQQVAQFGQAVAGSAVGPGNPGGFPVPNPPVSGVPGEVGATAQGSIRALQQAAARAALDDVGAPRRLFRADQGTTGLKHQLSPTQGQVTFATNQLRNMGVTPLPGNKGSVAQFQALNQAIQGFEAQFGRPPSQAEIQQLNTVVIRQVQ